MKLFILWIATGATATFEEDDTIINPNTTFLEVKGFIRMRYGFKPQQLLLVCNRTLAEDHEPLKMYGITSSETAQAKPIGCHVFSLEEAAAEQADLDAEVEAEKAETERKKKHQQQQQQEQEQEKEQADEAKKQEQSAAATSEHKDKDKNNKHSTILEFTIADYHKALKILGKEKPQVSAARMQLMSHDGVPRHRPKFLDEAKSRKEAEAREALQQRMQREGDERRMKLIGKELPEQQNNNDDEDDDSSAADWSSPEAQRLREIFKLGLYGARRKEADAAFALNYPDYKGEGPLELWDVREDIMSAIAPDAHRKPLVVELFSLAEVEKGVQFDILGALVSMKMQQHGLHIRVLDVREAGCTYPLLAVQVTGDKPADIRKLGEVFFEDFGLEQGGVDISKSPQQHNHNAAAGAGGGRKGNDDDDAVAGGSNWGAVPPMPEDPEKCLIQ